MYRATKDIVLPTTINDYIGGNSFDAVAPTHPAVTAVETEVRARLSRLLSINGTRTVEEFHRELGLLMWDHCGMSRNESGLRKALERVPELRAEFWRSVRVPGEAAELNQELEKANRVADFLELAELMPLDALLRDGLADGLLELLSQPAVPDRGALREVDAPALVIGCRGDVAHPPSVAEQLARTLPNATLHIYDQPAVLWTNRIDLRTRISGFFNSE